MIVAGFLAGAILPYLTGRQSILTAVVQCAYGALAGWAVGAVIAHLRGER